MQKWFRQLRHLICALVLISVTQPAVALETREELQEAGEVLAYGLRAIDTRTLKATPLATTTVEGLRGLTSIDPAFAITDDGQIIEAFIADEALGTWAHPTDDTAEAWALIALDITVEAQKKSWSLDGLDTEEFYQAFFDSALTPLDPFSRYAGRAEAEKQQERRNGFGGIGVRYRLYRHYLEITQVLTGTPAEAAKLEPGDRIVQVNDVVIDSLSRRAVHKLLRGPVDSPVTLVLRKKDTEREVSLKRGLVSAPTAFLDMVGNIPRLRITHFSQQTAALARELLEKTFTDTTDHPGLILDLRGNPGGLLDQAVSISDLFITSGDIVSTRGRHPNTLQSYQATMTDVPGGDMLHGKPILVLIDGRTASAAEILAAALQSSGRAVVAGTTSYGKGTVQTVVAMPNGGELTITWSRFFTPSGYALHGLGVMPTLCTSERQTSPEDLMLDLARGTLPAVVNYQKWLRVDLEDHDGRRALRRTCPPTDHANRDALDFDVAQAIFQTPGAYRAALSAIHTAFAEKQ